MLSETLFGSQLENTKGIHFMRHMYQEQVIKNT